MRPTDWGLVDQRTDPTPGDPAGPRQLAREFDTIATTAAEVATIVRRVQADTEGGIWIGKAGDSFRGKLGSLPEDSAKCAASYEIARDAMTYWATQMAEFQTSADTHLATARRAHADLAGAKNELAAALAAQATATRERDTATDLYQRYKDTTPPPTVSVPTARDLRAADSATLAATLAVSGARQQVDAAEALLAAAKRGVADAKAGYEDAARQVTTRLGAARAAGVRADTWWEKIINSAFWKTLTAIAAAIVTVLSIVAIFTPLGPLLAGVLLLANAVLVVDFVARMATEGVDIVELLTNLIDIVIPAVKGAMKGVKTALGQVRGVEPTKIRSDPRKPTGSSSPAGTSRPRGESPPVSGSGTPQWTHSGNWDPDGDVFASPPHGSVSSYSSFPYSSSALSGYSMSSSSGISTGSPSAPSPSSGTGNVSQWSSPFPDPDRRVGKQPYQIQLSAHTTYRADSRPPEQIFKEGFMPKNPYNHDLEGFVTDNNPANFVSTSKRADLYKQWGADYRYTVKKPGGIHVNKTLPKPPYPYEQEIAFADGISPQSIQGARPVHWDDTLGPEIRNPHYVTPSLRERPRPYLPNRPYLPTSPDTPTQPYTPPQTYTPTQPDTPTHPYTTTGANPWPDFESPSNFDPWEQ